MVEFTSLPIIGVFITLLAYYFAEQLNKNVKSVFTNPVLITIGIIIILLLLFNIDFEDYNKGGKFISFFLGPSVVALGVLLYEKFNQIKQNLYPFLLAVLVGGVCSIFSVIFILSAFNAPDILIISLASKSVTTPIAIEITKSVGGIPAITAGIVIAVGIFGNAFGVYILKGLRIKSKTAIGTALGTAAHGIGTARALEESKLAGVYSGLALCINGIITAIITPFIIEWFFN